MVVSDWKLDHFKGITPIFLSLVWTVISMGTIREHEMFANPQNSRNLRTFHAREHFMFYSTLKACGGLSGALKVCTCDKMGCILIMWFKGLSSVLEVYTLCCIWKVIHVWHTIDLAISRALLDGGLFSYVLVYMFLFSFSTFSSVHYHSNFGTNTSTLHSV